MKCAAVFVIVSLAFLSQAFAVLRPLFPVKPAPPFGDQVIIIGDELVPAFYQRTPQLRGRAIDLDQIVGSGD